jgi:class 3 adenylate cyclase
MATQEQISTPTLPTGEVTLLFTDIVGSSRLWEEHGDRFIPVWQTHDAILRDAFGRYNGYEVKSEGDAFMVVFDDAANALHCALFAQEALARYPWPADIGPPRVRIGLHTGEPFQHGNDYFGPVVNRAAYICKAAHGGQVLLSEETRRAVADRLDPDIELQDLGDFPMKDMGLPQQLHQAHRPGMEARSFPPPRTLASQPNNLPLQRTSFVGRAQEIEQIAAYLASGEKPALTLTGPGGIGKTRLSLQAAASRAEWFPDGVWYIQLVEARDVVGAAVEIASAMHIPLNPAQPPLPQVRAWLADRHCLLILDDAGTLPQADRLIRELLSGSSNLRCLATSRESLQIAEADDIALTGLPTAAVVRERAPLSAPSVGENAVETNALTKTEAGRLFLERLAAVNPNVNLSPSETAAAEELLRRLGGVPASVERAAQLMDRVLPSTVLNWLDQRLPPESAPVRPGGAEKLKGFLRRSAQKAVASLEEPIHALKVNMGPLLQGIADIATDLRNENQAAALGRESLRLSQEAGDELGAAAALRQLARVKWRQGDRQSAATMLAAAARIYRRHNAADYPEVQRELDDAREELEQSGNALPALSSFEAAVALALKEKS